MFIMVIRVKPLDGGQTHVQIVVHQKVQYVRIIGMVHTKISTSVIDIRFRAICCILSWPVQRQQRQEACRGGPDSDDEDSREIILSIVLAIWIRIQTFARRFWPWYVGSAPLPSSSTASTNSLSSHIPISCVSTLPFHVILSQSLESSVSRKGICRCHPCTRALNTILGYHGIHKPNQMLLDWVRIWMLCP